MQSITRNKFVAAVAAGVITCAAAVATATTSNADPSTPSTSATGSTSVAPGSTSQTHVTVTPILQIGVHGLGMAGFQIDGVIYAGADPVEYTSSEIYLDGKLIHSSDGATGAPDARLRSVHATFVPEKTVPVSPGKHTVKVHVTYPTGPGETDYQQVTVSRTVTVGPVDNPSSTPTTQPPPDHGGSDEPPTPSPRTTQLGVTG